jgi:hypothetical protein
MEHVEGLELFSSLSGEDSSPTTKLNIIQKSLASEESDTVDLDRETGLWLSTVQFFLDKTPEQITTF